MTVHVTTHARLDTLDGAEWYDRRSAGRGDKFLAEFQQTADRIGRHPRANGRVSRCPRSREVRETLVGRYPFRLVYEIISGEVWVLSVTHTRAKRQPWRRRLP